MAVSSAELIVQASRHSQLQNATRRATFPATPLRAEEHNLPRHVEVRLQSPIALSKRSHLLERRRSEGVATEELHVVPQSWFFLTGSFSLTRFNLGRITC